MGDVIDIFTKRKREAESYFKRLKTCEKTAQDKGYCDCEACKLKTQLVNELIRYILVKCGEYDGVNKNPALYGGDVLEILVSAARRFFNDLSDKE